LKTLIYVPIIHSIADMGSLKEELKNKSISALGENVWQRHMDTVNAYWDSIEGFFEHPDFPAWGIKIFQDGLFAEGEMALKIIDEGVKSGSKNSQIVSNLIQRGALLVRTEDLNMVKTEYDGLQSVLKAKNQSSKLLFLLIYKLSKPYFLYRRDKFIADRIAGSLAEDETGILFIGAYHNIVKRLPGGIKVTELKEIAKMRDYQGAIQRGSVTGTLKFEQLTAYVIKEINPAILQPQP